ncbi:hypothetical protein L2E82_08772 [Cichorium intybus]|uniref:Uncharacterized protein n=1 Tax=Cichorium intybus TaxID=13427 RepID=A0ACB9G821_CICIN|nr:hypothetical protein L2E82_08772 [Cichorium intybus]
MIALYDNHNIVSQRNRYTTAIDASHSLPKNSTIDASLSLSLLFAFCLSISYSLSVFSITTSTIEIHEILLKKKQEQGKNKLLSHLSISVVEDKEAKFYGCKVGAPFHSSQEKNLFKDITGNVAKLNLHQWLAFIPGKWCHHVHNLVDPYFKFLCAI